MFRTELVARAMKKRGCWRLELPVVWESEAEIIVIPAGFVTDLASIPRVFQSLIPVNGRHRLPAVLHDYLYVIQDRSRAEADRLFLEAMASEDVRVLKRNLMHSAVRVGGWRSWGSYKRKLEIDRAAFFESKGLF